MKHLPDVKPLTWKGDLAARMVAGMDKYLRRATAEHAAQRERTWKRDTQSWARYEKSVAPNRQRLAKFLGVVDERVEVEMIAWGRVSSRGQCRREDTPAHAGYSAQAVRWTVLPGLTAEGLLLEPEGEAVADVVALGDADWVPEEVVWGQCGREDTPAHAGYSAQAVRWTVLPGLTAEGLLLEPEGEAVADVVALGDADWVPEEVVWGQCGREDTPAHAGFAGRLAASGCRVLVPTLINRDCELSGVAGCMTNQPHREFIYRAAYELGRHVIGLEVQKVLAAVDWFGGGASGASASTRPVGVIGYGEGGLLALHAAALDARIGAVVVSGYFGPREGLFAEPIYRNVWRLLEEFGDAEVASLIAPRMLVVEHCPFPEISGPPPVSEGRSGAAPGSIETPTAGAVRKEMARARELLGRLEAPFTLVEAKAPGSDAALGKFVQALALPAELAVAPLSSPGAGSGCHGQPRWPCGAAAPDPRARLKRQFDEMVEWTQALMRESEYIRRDYWAPADATDVKSWVKTTKTYRKRFHEEVIGALPEPDMPPNPRARRAFATEAFTGYEVVLDVYPDVFAYGLLLVPHDLAPGERRPVVVCQHGLEGRPQDVADPSVEGNCYYQFACRLAERGFVTFAPQNPYIGYDAFRVLQRMANPLGLSLFSFIIRQHQRLLEFLKTLPYVDGKRLAFYGLSYGGKTAMRVPAVLEDYCLSICSGDFNEWIWKNASTRAPFTYMRTGEYEMFEFDLGMTFNYAEMSYLICPRPFMVERGHWDGCSWDEWVAYEYAKTNYRYDLLGIGDRTEIETFNGPHEIHAVGTFAFLEKHLRGQ